MILKFLEHGFHIVAECSILLLECIGLAILLVSALKSLIGCIRKDSHVQLVLGEGIALTLEFLMGGEVIRTALAEEPKELLTLGAIVLLRAALTFLLHWELKEEKAETGA